MKCLFFFLSGFIYIFSTTLDAQWKEQNGEPTIEDTLAMYEGLFEDEEPLGLTLKFNVKELQRTRRQEDYQPAELSIGVNDTVQVAHPVRVKARGIFRRDNCTIPPFWLNIRYSGIETEELQGIRRMKMVTRCRSSQLYEDYILREYLVYKIYNVVSPYSFNVRLIRLKYIDTGRKDREQSDWAFLIEPDDMMAERLKARVIENDKLSSRTVNTRVMDLLAMFQYMIGNGDYSVTGRHNLEILALDPPGPLGYIPVPYDFDYTGLVNTQYAVPGEGLGISSVRERCFLGPCRSDKRFTAIINELAGFKEEIQELILGFEYLDEGERMDMIAYIESFFQETAHENFIERNIQSTCR